MATAQCGLARFVPTVRLITWNVVTVAAVCALAPDARAGTEARPATARVRVAPAAAAPGTTVRIRGSGLRPQRLVTASLGAEAPPARTRTNRRGSFSLALPVPPTTARRILIRVGGAGRSLPFRVLCPRPRPLGFPLRAAFYYPWFPEAWTQGGYDPYTRFTPLLGRYDVGAAATVRRHVGDMLYAGIDVGVASWWSGTHRSDARFPALLAGARCTPLRWAVFYELEGSADPSREQLLADLELIRRRYAGDPSYLRIDGRFVVFVWNEGDGADMAQRWRVARTAGAYVMLKVFSGYRSATAQPDGWFQYAPAQGAQDVAGHAYSVSPGFWHVKEPIARLERSLDRFRADTRAMVASRAPWQLVTTFNEWGEGTAVEGAREWASKSGYGAYLDALRTHGR